MKKQKPKPLMLIDAGVIQDYFEGKEKTVEIFNKIKEVKKALEKKNIKEDDQPRFVTTIPSILSALYNLELKQIDVKKIKTVLDCLEILILMRGEKIGKISFKDSERRVNEILKIADILSRPKGIAQ